MAKSTVCAGPPLLFLVLSQSRSTLDGHASAVIQLLASVGFPIRLNPDEQVWKNVKERVAKQMICNVHEMQPLARAALERLQALPEIIRGFFRHPECGFYK